MQEEKLNFSDEEMEDLKKLADEIFFKLNEPRSIEGFINAINTELSEKSYKNNQNI